MTQRGSRGNWKVLNGRRVAMTPRFKAIVDALERGATYAQVARAHQITKQMVHKIRVLAGLPARRSA